MTKIVEIDRCDDCPNFDNEYYSYNEKCVSLDRVIKREEGSYVYQIPEDCPLEDFDL